MQALVFGEPGRCSYRGRRVRAVSCSGLGGGGGAARLPRALVRARDEHRVDGVDDAVVARDVGGPVRGLGGALGLEADDRVVEPVLAELAVRGEGAAVERLLVRVEAVHGDLAGDHVVLEDVGAEGAKAATGATRRARASFIMCLEWGWGYCAET